VSSAQVANVQIGDLSDDTGGGLLDLGGIVDDLLGGGGTLGLGSLFDDLFGGTLSADLIRSECESRLSFDGNDRPGSRGETEVVGLEVLGDAVGDDGALLNLDDNPLVLALEDALDIDLLALRVVVNEQVVTRTRTSTGITVNALRLTILGDADTTDANAVDDDSLLDIIIAQSRCALNFGPTGTTTTLPDGTTTTVPDGPDGPDDNDARNDSDISNESNGTAVIETGDANAVGNVANTEINQTADAAGGSDGVRDGNADVDQDATVVNVGEANANTGANTAIGNNSLNVARNRQRSVAVGDDGIVDPCCPGPEATNTASNTSSATNVSDGTAAVTTGDANAAGNVADTEINQTGTAADGGGGSVPCGGTCAPEPCGECPGQCPDPEPECPAACEPEPEPCDPTPCGDPCDNDDDPCGCWWNPRGRWGGFGGSSSASQSATVVNSGSANANTGGNTAIGNNSTNVVTNEQTAVAVDD
jgi:hypothetical protein